MTRAESTKPRTATNTCISVSTRTTTTRLTKPASGPWREWPPWSANWDRAPAGGSARYLFHHYGCHVACLNLSDVQNARNRAFNGRSRHRGVFPHLLKHVVSRNSLYLARPQFLQPLPRNSRPYIQRIRPGALGGRRQTRLPPVGDPAPPEGLSASTMNFGLTGLGVQNRVGHHRPFLHWKIHRLGNQVFRFHSTSDESFTSTPSRSLPPRAGRARRPCGFANSRTRARPLSVVP